ncbi:hypothetical protein D3C87_1037570 [compost metagenome]
MARKARAAEQRHLVDAIGVQLHVAQQVAGIAQRGVAVDHVHGQGALDGGAGAVGDAPAVDQAHAHGGPLDGAAGAGVDDAAGAAADDRASGQRAGARGTDDAAGVGDRTAIGQGNAEALAFDEAAVLIDDRPGAGDDFHAPAVVAGRADGAGVVGDAASRPDLNAEGICRDAPARRVVDHPGGRSPTARAVNEHALAAAAGGAQGAAGVVHDGPAHSGLRGDLARAVTRDAARVSQGGAMVQRERVAHRNARIDLQRRRAPGAVVHRDRPRAQRAVARGNQRAFMDGRPARIGVGAREGQRAAAHLDQAIARAAAVGQRRGDAGTDARVGVDRGLRPRGRCDGQCATRARHQAVAVGGELQGVEALRSQHGDGAARGACEDGHRAQPVARRAAVGNAPVGAEAVPGASAPHQFDAARRGDAAVPELQTLSRAQHREVDLAWDARTWHGGGYLVTGGGKARSAGDVRTAETAADRGGGVADTVVEQTVPASRRGRRPQGATQREVAAHVDQVVAHTAHCAGLAQFEDGGGAAAEREVAADGQRAGAVAR